MNRDRFSSIPACCRNCIHDIVLKIDQIQKEAILEDECESCESPLTRNLFNTRPITFYLKTGSAFTVEIPETTETSNVFRIEEIRGDCVTLRILKQCGTRYICTDYTAILNLCCVCGIQCFQPICCKECKQRCKTY